MGHWDRLQLQRASWALVLFYWFWVWPHPLTQRGFPLTLPYWHKKGVFCIPVPFCFPFSMHVYGKRLVLHLLLLLLVNLFLFGNDQPIAWLLGIADGGLFRIATLRLWRAQNPNPAVPSTTGLLGVLLTFCGRWTQSSILFFSAVLLSCWSSLMRGTASQELSKRLFHGDSKLRLFYDITGVMAWTLKYGT